MRGKKQIRSTKAQLRKLVDFMSINKQFANGEFTGPLGAHNYEAKWLHLKKLLCEFGPDKSVEQWKQTWRDLKRKARHSIAEASNVQSQTRNAGAVDDVDECSTGIGPQESHIGQTEQSVNLEDEEDIIIVNNEIEMELDTPPGHHHPSTLGSVRRHICQSQPEVSVKVDPKDSHQSTTSEVPNIFVALQKQNNYILNRLCDVFAEHNSLTRELKEEVKELNNHMKQFLSKDKYN